MIIRGLQVNGFGIFSQVDVQGFSPGLNIIVGDNEAGKSTILAFLRVMLFGFPRNSQGVNAYPPLNGGVHGGSLILDGPDGPVVLTRSPGTYGGTVSIAYPDGSMGGRDALLHMLGGTTATLYNNVYAFSLTELETIQSLTNEEVASALYGASLGAGLRTLSHARKKISQRLGDLFKSAGKKPEINQKLLEYKENARLIAQASKDADIYQSSAQELERIEGEIQASRDLVKELNQEIHFCTNIMNLWNDWIDYSQALKRLNSLPPGIIPLPENAQDQLEAINESMEVTRQEIRAFQEELEAQKVKAVSLHVEAALMEQEKSIAALSSEHAGYRENLQNLQRITNQIEYKSSEISVVCDSLGTGWNRERLANFKGSLFLKQELDKNEAAIGRVSEELQHALSQESLRNEHLEEIRAEEKVRKDALEKQGGGDSSWESAFQAGHDPLAEARTGGKKMTGLLTREERVKQDLDHHTQRMADHALYAWRRNKVLLAVIVLAAFVLAGMGLMFFNRVWYLSVPVILLGLLVSGAILVQTSKAHPSERFRKKLAGQDKEYAKMVMILKTIGEDLDAARQQMRILADSHGLPFPVTSEDISRFIDHTDNDSERYRVWAGLRAGLEETRSKAESALKRLQEAKTLVLRAEISQSDCQAQWQSWLDRQGFPATLSPGSARDALAAISKGAELLREVSSDEQSRAQCQERIDEFEHSLRQLAGNLSMTCPPPGMVQSFLQDLARRLEKSKENFAVQKQLESSMALAEKRIREKRQVIAVLEQKKMNLLALSQAESEQGFLEQCQLSREHAALKAREESALTSMAKISGEKDVKSLLDLLDTLDGDMCRIRMQEAQDALNSAEDEFQALNARRADLRAEMKNMASDATISFLRAREAELAEEIRSLALEWGAYTLAGSFLERAVSCLEQEQQPEVITRAGTMFRDITDGRYARIYAPLGEKDIELIMADGSRKRPEQLSRGTAELLYLCLRMGYVYTRSLQGANLPVVMDDVLVNFDATRATQAAQAISGLARDHQVFLFTCHKHLLQLFESASTHPHIYTLHHGEMAPV